jgi:hypothetical protein
MMDYNKRADFIQAYGSRPRIAMKAALLVMPETQATEQQKRLLLDDADFRSLNAKSRTSLPFFSG